jgi:hypothetical protein
MKAQIDLSVYQEIINLTTKDYLSQINYHS